MLFNNLFVVLDILLILVASIRAGENVASIRAGENVASIRAGENTTYKLRMRCRDNERRTLLEFKAGLFDDHGILSSWSNKSNEVECCNWIGIWCSNRTGHVTGLNLPGSFLFHTNFQLIGKISPSLGELRHLKYLNLTHNSFYGEIPPQLGNLTNLRSLDLRGNFQLKVENLEWVSHLQLLTHLDLSSISLSNCSNWLNQIYKLSSLTHLTLVGSNPLDQFGPLINTSFLSLNSLVVADLSSNSFVSPKSYNWLFNFTTTLVYLDLSKFSFLRSEIPEGIGRIISLQSLYLSYSKLEGVLPDSFMNLTHLATLDLRYNNLNGSLSEFLRPFANIKKNSLQDLYLNDNQLSGSLPRYISRFPSLRKMLIYNNKLNGPFPDNFWQLFSSLVYLDLSNNQLTGIIPNLTLFSPLEKLALNDNKLEGAVPRAFLSHLSKLSYLDLSSNSLSFNSSVDWFPPFKLDTILLENCTLGPHFPNWIRSQRNFSTIDLSHARIFDTIPHWFWDLSPILRNLNMSNNQMQGVLPNISLAFPNIDRIDLSYNLLQGHIPPLGLGISILDLTHNMFTGSHSLICTRPYKQLYYLDLSNNKLSGDLPPACFMNNSLTLLNLANNNFSGNIPTSIGTHKFLLALQLRNNSFTGQITQSMMNNTNLELLDLSGNKLNGEIPTWIGTDLTSLIVLSLRMNEFSGSIPPQICHLRKAQVLDLSQNNLTGSIPYCISNFTSLVEKENYNPEFGIFIGDGFGSNFEVFYPNALLQWKRVASEYKTTLPYLKLIDLSGNGLVGEIPEEFSTLKELISLNLSSNRLTGNIIKEIGQMKNLETLDLSRNHLSGNIPSSLASLTLLSVLDVSNNNLTGKIPSSTQLQSFHPSDFEGNEYLCGPPLKKCSIVISLPNGHDDENNEEDDVKSSKFWLYVSVVLGFGTGFWGFLCPLILRRTWRHPYYKWLGSTADWICVTTTLHMSRLQRKFYG